MSLVQVAHDDDVIVWNTELLVERFLKAQGIHLALKLLMDDLKKRILEGFALLLLDLLMF